MEQREDTFLKQLKDAGIVNSNLTLDDLRKRVRELEVEGKTVGDESTEWSAVVDSDKWGLVMK